MAEAQTHVFRVSLSPKVYRDFEILSAKNLYDLAGEIVRAFGFDFDHAFGFYSGLKPATMMRVNPRYEHVLGIQLGANLYTKAFASPQDCMTTATCASDIGLDAGGHFGYFGFGYTYRFNTPLGSAPFVTLE